MRLKELRKGKKVSQNEFAELFNVTQATVSRWETNEILPDADTLIKIANYFDITVDYLLENSGVKNLTTLQADLSDDEQMIIANYRKLNNKGKDYIKQTIEMAVVTYTNNFFVPGMEAAK